MRFISNSVDETIKIGTKLAKKLKKGDVVALVGDLGSGKTVFTKGIAKGLGVKSPRYVNSPTFVIIKEYKGKFPLYHFDLYRLDPFGGAQAPAFKPGTKGAAQGQPRASSGLKAGARRGVDSSSALDVENFEEYFYGDGISVIEWADKIRKCLPAKYIEVRLSVAGEGKRRIEIRS